MAILYILHFSAPYKGCCHYIGMTDNFDKRMKCHRAGSGAKLMKAVLNAGIDFEAFIIGEGGREEEKKLKASKNSKRHCPKCKKR